MKRELVASARIGIVAFPLFLLTLSCVATHEKVKRPSIETTVHPFKEINVEFEHKWAETNHPFSGAAVIDVDQDGRMEIFIGGGEGQPDALLQYQQGRLVNVIEGSGLSSHTATHGATSLDMDNDGDTDLLLARADGIYLYSNSQGTFSESKIPLNLENDAVPLAIAVSDVNHDGHGDLYISVFITKEAFRSATFNDPTHAKHNVMLLNNGDLTFTDITQSSGTASKQNTFFSAFVDLNNDGWQDLVVAQNTGEVEIFQNQRNTSFQRVDTDSGFGFWMGLAVGDVDNDGDQDLFFTNVGTSIPEFLIKGDLKESQRLEYQWLLLRNDGKFLFTNVTGDYDLKNYGFAWGAVFEDINLDGHLDLLIAQNYIKWPLHKFNKLPGKAFLQLPTSDTNSFFHFDELGINNPYFGQSPVIADLDGNSKPDVIWLNMNGPARAFLNQSESNAISVVLPDNVQSLGTQVTVETGGSKTYTKEIVTSTGLMSDQTPTLFFGLGELTDVEKVSIRSANGKIRVIEHPPVNQRLILK